MLDVCGAPALTAGSSAGYARAGRTRRPSRSSAAPASPARCRWPPPGAPAPRGPSGWSRSRPRPSGCATAGLADEVALADARDPVALAAAVTAALGGPADVTVVCVDVPGCEHGAILATADGGTVIFFSMATSFAAAALGAEGLAADVTMLVGNGYVPGHAEYALALLRSDAGVRALFEPASRPRLAAPTRPRQTDPMSRSTTLYRGGHVYSPADPTRHGARWYADGRIAWLGSDADAPAADRHRRAGRRAGHAGVRRRPRARDRHRHRAARPRSVRHPLGRRSARSRWRRTPPTLPADAVVLGHGWDESSWTEQTPPAAAELDRAGGGRPVYLSQVSVHSAVVSSDAARADPDRQTRRATTRSAGCGATPTTSYAGSRWRRARPTPNGTARQRAALRAAAALGIAAVHECGGPGPPTRTTSQRACARPGAGPARRVRLLGRARWRRERRRELGAVGAAATCTPTARSARRRRTCASRTSTGDPTHRGHAYVTAEQAASTWSSAPRPACRAASTRSATRRSPPSWPGSRSPRRSWASTGSAPARHRIEHAEIMDKALIAGFVEYGIVASMQPAFDRLWGGDARDVRPAPGRRAVPASQPDRFACRGRRGAGVRLRLAGDPAGPVGHACGRR